MMNSGFISVSCHRRCGTLSSKLGAERSHYYERQRTDPHYLHPSGGEYIFVRSELDGKCADKLRRCATVTSVQELLLEAEDVLEYLKRHNGIVDQPINDDENIVEDATCMQLDGDANGTPAVMTEPEAFQQQMQSTLQLSWQPLPCAYA